MNFRRLIPALLVIVAGLNSVAHAQRKEAIDPPGFVRISSNGKEISCSPDDEKWLRRAIADYKRPALPSTMPSDLLTRLNDQRADLTKQMIEDLALPNEKFVAPMFDANLIPQLQRLSQFKAPFVYLVATRDQVKNALASGWTDPRYSYNRSLGEFTYDDSVQLGTDRPMDDAMLWISIEPNESVEDRTKKILESISHDDEGIDQMVWSRGNVVTQDAFASLIGDQVITPLNLNNQQQWIGLGIAGVLSAKYASELIGVPYDEIITRMTTENPDALLKAEQVDLLSPIPASQLQPEHRGLYENAFRRKSTMATYKLVKSSPPGSIAKLLVALRKKLPIDGQGLLTQIQELTQVDLKHDVTPQN